MTFRQFVRAILVLTYLTPTLLAAPEAIEIGPKNTADLPGGREADGIIGDFVLRNDRIEAVISGGQHNRRANMFTHWGKPTGGCLYDLTLRGQNNDQLTWLGPGRQEGPLSRVYILKDGSDGEAIVRAELTAMAGGGIGKTHDYILKDDWQYLVIVSTYHNATDQTITVQPAPGWKGLTFGFGVDSIVTGLCQDPSDRVGYAYKAITYGSDTDPDSGIRPAVADCSVPAGSKRRFASAVSVGKGSLNAYGVLAGIGNPAFRVRGKVVDKQGKPATNATIHLPKGDKTLVAYVDDKGRFDFSLRTDSCEVILKDLGRPNKEVTLPANQEHMLIVPVAGGVDVTVTDEAGHPLPCKVQFIGIDGTDTPHLGPIVRAHGCDNLYQSENGRFRQQLPTGKYRLVITRGIEYDHAERTVEIAAGTLVPVKVTLKRIVDTTGWVSTDFHNHTTVSGDNYCGTDDRIINLAAENVEFAPATEHNRIYDWQPHIDKLGLKEHVATVVGIEFTGSGPHLNAFPLEVVPYTQDNGGPDYNVDGRISALLLRRMAGEQETRWVQVNHPHMAKFFAHLRADAEPDEGLPRFEDFIDGAELWGEKILSGQPRFIRVRNDKEEERENWPFVWMQLANAGTFIPTVAVSDAHRTTNGGVGGWRLYVRSTSDEPAKIDSKEIIANAKACKSFVTSGPFLQVTTSDDKGPGDTVISSDPVRLHVRVQCNTWVDVDRVAVLVNGRIDPKLDFREGDHPDMFKPGVVRFEQDLKVELKEDAYLVVTAVAENSTLAMGYGKSWQKDLHPTAYHNPIRVDVDGDGFEPNGDDLGHPLLGAAN
jgi:hypothetical protein